MTYWLVNSGTTEDPYQPPRDDIGRRFREWDEEWGDVQMFDRAYAMRRGDVLIHRAIGSDGNRLIAVARVLGGPVPSGHTRWKYKVRRELTSIASSLLAAPTLDDIGEHPVRVVKRLDPATGRLAERLIRTAAEE